MRTIVKLNLWPVAAALAWVAFAAPSTYAQGTAFSYQGQLMNNGQPATGNYDITFTLFAYSQYGFSVGPVLTNIDTPVNGGLFSTTLDFGAVFNGSNYWLEIAVRTNGNGYFTTLEPRQLLAPVPYAVFSANASNAVTALTANTATSAASVPASGIVGTIPLSNLSSNIALLTANGTLPTNVLPTNLTSPSGIVWQSPSATTLQAQPNTGYVFTNSKQVTITLPATPNVGDIVELTGAGLGGWILAQNAGQTIAASFTPLSLPGDASGYWYSIASSSDGTKLAAVTQNVVIGGTYSDPGGVWTSINAGTNWGQISALPNGYSGGLLSIASSSDGTKLALAAGTAGIYISTNSGTNFLKTTAPTNVYWQSIAVSSDGAKMVAANDGLVGVGFDGGIWISSNSGTNWAEAADLPLAQWQSVASSSNGVILAAAAGYVYIGEDSYPGGVWISSNAGATWAQTSVPAGYWTSVASSSDGTMLAVVGGGLGVNVGGIWTSSNSGTNWGQISAPGVDWVSTLSTSSWWSIASSSDGTKLAAGINDGGIWTILNGVVNHQSAAVSGSTIVGTTGFLEGNFGTVVELIYAGGGQFIALYQTGSFSGH